MNRHRGGACSPVAEVEPESIVGDRERVGLWFMAVIGAVAAGWRRMETDGK